MIYGYARRIDVSDLVYDNNLYHSVLRARAQASASRARSPRPPEGHNFGPMALVAVLK